jgi:hypothetical protein
MNQLIYYHKIFKIRINYNNKIVNNKIKKIRNLKSMIIKNLNNKK